jgi:hypothetical protein
MRRPPVALALVAAALCAGVAGQSDKMGSGEMFDAIAPRYDLINTFLSLGMHKWWRARMVAALDLQPGDHVLDLGTGTADVAIEVANMLKKKVGSTALSADAVVGVDPRYSQPHTMLTPTSHARHLPVCLTCLPAHRAPARVCSNNMLEHGRRKVAAAGYEASSVRLVQVSVRPSPFPPQLRRRETEQLAGGGSGPERRAE